MEGPLPARYVVQTSLPKAMPTDITEIGMELDVLRLGPAICVESRVACTGKRLTITRNATALVLESLN